METRNGNAPKEQEELTEVELWKFRTFPRKIKKLIDSRILIGFDGSGAFAEMSCMSSEFGKREKLLKSSSFYHSNAHTITHSLASASSIFTELAYPPSKHIAFGRFLIAAFQTRLVRLATFVR